LSHQFDILHATCGEYTELKQ